MTSSAPFPTSLQRPLASAQRLFWRHDDTRCGDASCHFSVLLPRGWAPLDTPPAAPGPDGDLVSLAVFRAADRGAVAPVDAEVEVHVCRLPREVAPADWLDLYLQSGGFTVLERRERDTDGGAVADALTRRPSPEGPMVTRWLTLKNNDHLFVIEGRAREAAYPSAAEAIFMALTSVTLLHPVDWPLAERLRSFSRRAPGDFLLMYPESWTLRRDVVDDERALQVSLIQRLQDLVVGEIVFATVARSAESHPQALAERFAGDLRRAGATLDGVRLIPDTPQSLHRGFAATWRTTTAAVLHGRPMEIRAWAAERPDAWFFAGMFGPAREGFAEAWCVNKRAFAIVCHTLRVP